MICPQCNIPMNHLNKGGGFSGVDAYETWDTLQCPQCTDRAIEVYYTQFLKKGAIGKPIISITQH